MASREQVITAARLYAAAHEVAVKVYEVVLPEWAEEMYVANPGEKPQFATLIEDTAVTMLPLLRKHVPAGTEFREIYRATPPQWN